MKGYINKNLFIDEKSAAEKYRVTLDFLQLKRYETNHHEAAKNHGPPFVRIHPSGKILNNGGGVVYYNIKDLEVWFDHLKEQIKKKRIQYKKAKRQRKYEPKRLG